MQEMEGWQDHHSKRQWRPDTVPVAHAVPRVAESVAALIHDTRNMVASMELYCDLLDEPGVLAPQSRHYAGELRLVAGASRRLLESLSILDLQEGAAGTRGRGIRKRGMDADSKELEWMPDPFALDGAEYPILSRPGRLKEVSANPPVTNLAEQLQANRNLLSALVGSGITVALSVPGPASAVLCTIAMSADNLTRILINLARNAASAMPAGGQIQIELHLLDDSLELTFSDSGTGIPEAALETIFSPGYTTKTGLDGHAEDFPRASAFPESLPGQIHGLGLAIVRALVESAGGTVHAVNRIANLDSGVSGGAMIVIRFPINP
jgi:signal transduction histidine kinase